MIELGELEANYQEFEKRKTRVVVVSVEDQEAAKITQADFPHLLVVADAEHKLADAMQVIHRKSAPDGRDTSAPTTIIVDGDGIVRWTHRPSRSIVRLTPDEVLAALDSHLP